MPSRKRKDPNRTAAKQVAKVTRTELPKGEDLLGSEEARDSVRGLSFSGISRSFEHCFS